MMAANIQRRRIVKERKEDKMTRDELWKLECKLHHASNVFRYVFDETEGFGLNCQIPKNMIELMKCYLKDIDDFRSQFPELS